MSAFEQPIGPILSKVWTLGAAGSLHYFSFLAREIPFIQRLNSCSNGARAGLRVSLMNKKRRKRSSNRFDVPANFYEAVYRLVVRIPRGRVMTYGQIAAILGSPRAARAVGYAMRACPDGLPWQRVINGKGQISGRSEVERPIVQRLLLEKEGVRFDRTETCDLGRLQWEPKDAERFYYEGSAAAPFR